MGAEKVDLPRRPNEILRSWRAYPVTISGWCAEAVPARSARASSLRSRPGQRLDPRCRTPYVHGLVRTRLPGVLLAIIAVDNRDDRRCVTRTRALPGHDNKRLARRAAWEDRSRI